ncbi:MAG: hypothetical protein L6R30_11945 [Thermoanaerobaculia bacterium]|nr:hypothetical protein [Thermoanaerobaculia bacterium]
MSILCALTGSPLPPRCVAAAIGRPDKAERRILRITHLRRAGSVAEALADVPQELPAGPPRVEVLLETSDYIGGPVMTGELETMARLQFKDRLGRWVRRRWEIIPLQAASGDRITDHTQWRAGVSRRVILAALVSLGYASRLKIGPSVPLAAAFQDGLASLREHRPRSEEELNPNEDLALAVALLAWWFSLQEDGTSRILK